jgi:hypothetical protein
MDSSSVDAKALAALVILQSLWETPNYLTCEMIIAAPSKTNTNRLPELKQD